jgi:CDP-diacylglycerol--glycerol-3-phosphate 3-phosphatidyltransferase
MAQIGAYKSVAVHMLGKIKTTIQMLAIPFLLLDTNIGWGIDTGQWGRVLIWVAAVLTVWSMIYYLRKAAPYIKENAK